jgi:hypothetical protein
MTQAGKTETLKKKRRDLREELWPGQRAWLSEREKGFFMAPRTLPLLMNLLDLKKVGGNLAPSSVYLELLSRHRSDGFIEVGFEEDHAAAAGYTGSQAKRAWRNRMAILEKHGFIKVKPSLGRQYGYVLLVHPSIAVSEMRAKGLVPDEWWEAYRARQIDAGEPLVETTATKSGGKAKRAAK